MHPRERPPSMNSKTEERPGRPTARRTNQKERKIKHSNRKRPSSYSNQVAKIHHHKGGILQPKVSDDTTRLRLPLAHGGGILSIYNFLQATSQISSSRTLLVGVIRNIFNQRLVDGNPVPNKNKKGGKNPPPHVLGNNPRHEVPVRAERRDTG